MAELDVELTTCADPECGAIAEVVDRWFLMSTDGPVMHVATLCLHRHRYTIPLEE